MKLNEEKNLIDFLFNITKAVGFTVFAVFILLGTVIFTLFYPSNATQSGPSIALSQSSSSTFTASTLVESEVWEAPDFSTIPSGTAGEQIKYGQYLVAHTAKYLGPTGSVLQISNGMNCQNCHLGAGTKPFGNNYSLVASSYPKVRARSGKSENIEKRVNDCFERSLNGQPLAPNSKEMEALVAYIKWVGKDVKKGDNVKGSGLLEMEVLDRAASPELGKAVYVQKCQTCHGQVGQGMKTPGNPEYQYPPLWGKNSYNDGAGLYRISNFARYVKANMPLGATHRNPQLTDEDAWDVAAYVNTMPRPKKNIQKDWPDISKKPFDHPFGPYKDSYSEHQHKYGPFKPIMISKN
ncbi:c-type cytochrome [Rufibacter quisquiliarum]|uniref:Thiosulfate dehydrogenase n=1 Tax=Rufibacter quisquiliarum TaxID=1549639 RepID=A0A839GQJ6_9BACT|nr:c-type cytochrome [Rufibacter quisquiliarum]MBA9079079.1 thiosulfate dehydrogenase [Rufibacter quisquiliarum]